MRSATAASPEEARAAWETIAPSYAAARRRPWPPVVRFLAGLPPGARVLDAGAGGGRHVAAAARAGLRCIALDAARGFRPEVHGDAAALPFREASFDAVLLVAVLGTMPRREDRVAALGEARRVLRPGGALLATVWAKWQDDYLRALVGRGTWRRVGPAEVLAPWSSGRTEVQRPYHLFTARDLHRHLCDGGWPAEGAVVERVRLGPSRLADNYVVRATRAGAPVRQHTFK